MTEDTQYKALLIIEALTLMWAEGPQTQERAQAFIGGIYRYSHIARGECKNPHADWLVELNQTYDNFVKQGVIAKLDEVENEDPLA